MTRTRTMNTLHDKETLFEDCLGFKQLDLHRKGYNAKTSRSCDRKAYDYLVHSTISIKPNGNNGDFESQFSHSIHKSSFYYLFRNGKERAPASKSVICKKEQQCKTDEYNALKVLISPIDNSSSKLYSKMNNEMPFELNQSSTEQHDGKEYDNDSKARMIFKNPFDSINGIDDDNCEGCKINSNRYSLFNHTNNDTSNNKNNKSSTTDLIYEAPKYSNGILNQLKMFNPNDEAFKQNQTSQPDNKEEEEEEEEKMISNKKLISTFTINNKDNPYDIKPRLNESDIEQINQKSFASFNLNTINYDEISVLNANNNLGSSNSSSETIKQQSYTDENKKKTKMLNQTHQAILLPQICDYIHSYFSIPANESKFQISTRLLTLINNRVISSLILKVNSSSLNALAHITSNSVDEELITERLNREYYENSHSFTSFETITSNLHRKIVYNEKSAIGKKNQIEDIKPHLIIANDHNALNSQIKEVSKHVAHYREVLCDGDGFYRAFAFGLIEHLIMTSKELQLKMICYDLTTKANEEFRYNNIAINQEVLIIITKIILTHIENKQLFEAFRVFTNALLTERDFELGLIKYVKITIADFIKLNFSRISKENQLIFFPKKYFSQNNNCLDVIDYINERILRMNYEPDVCLYYFAPIAFRINLQLLSFEKDKLFNHLFHCNYSVQSNKHEKICLLYTCARYYLGYSRSALKRKDAICYNNVLFNSKKKTRRFNVLERKAYCNTCRTESDEIASIRFKSQPLCKQCLINSLNKAIDLLLNNLVNDNYNHKEYYCKPIEIPQINSNGRDANETNSIKLYDDDFIELLGQSIPNIILRKIAVNCVECKTVLSIDSSLKGIVLSCNCFYCSNCIRRIASGLFKKDNTLKPKETFFTKKNTGDKAELIGLICKCGSPIQLRNIIPMLLKDSCDELTQIRDSIASMMSRRCFLCLKNTNSNRFKVENGSSFVNHSHVLCTKCKKRHQSLNNALSECAFCDEFHSLSLPIFHFKEEKKKFCNVNCCLII